MKNIEKRRNRTIAREANYHASMRAPHIDKTAISPYDDYCDGYGMPGAYGNGYVSVLKVSAGTVEKTNDALIDTIVTYDKAETADAYIGQINMLTASSFCGMAGQVWGYDLARHDDITSGKSQPLFTEKQFDGSELKVFDAAPLLNAVGLHFATDGYTPARRGHARDFLAWGYFQSERYFADFAPIIKEELRAKAAPAGPYAAQITAAAYPVCVHLRRGDYQKPENAILQVCTPDYYARAVAAVRDEHPDAALFVFSDDIDWAREHLDTAGLPAVFLPRGEAVADLAFMQLCRGFVLSNSTYSWWAQYLAPAPDKQTWAPDKWYAHTKKTALYQDGWQLIKTSPSGLRPQARVEA